MGLSGVLSETSQRAKDFSKAYVDLGRLKNILISTVNTMKQEKEYRQVFVVFDVDPY